MNDKYEVFIKLLNFLRNRYTPEKIFKDFISLFAITLSNKVYFNEKNKKIYDEIFKSYAEEENYIFSALSAELTRLFCNEDEPYDILGDIYKQVTNNSSLKLIKNDSKMNEVGRELQGVMKLNKKYNNGKMVELNCGSGAMILAYASTLKMFELDYKIDLDVAAIDTDLINVFMTYIQLYFYEISAIVILLDEKTNKEIMRLYTPSYEDDMEEKMVA
ncbi:MAG: hypothetical protein J6M60_00345 [Clostridia bacterium]|nr:hypothetical protein [Clostridia bacterium]